MGQFTSLPIPASISSTFCPWCIASSNHRTAVDTENMEQLNNLKQHYRQHMYEDLHNHKISVLEVRKQQQRQLKEYLEGLLLDKTS